MEATEEFAIFIYCQIPVVSPITSLVSKALIKKGYNYLTGTRTSCEQLAEEVIELVAFKELEEA